MIDVDKFLEQLSNDKTPPRNEDGDSLRITKMNMSARDNQGQVTYLPFLDAKADSFYVKLQGVKEILAPSTKFNDAVWYKLLPKSFYHNLTDSQSSLYDEVEGYIATINESGTRSYQTLRNRSYALFYGILLSHKPSNSVEEKTENVNKPVLLIFPSAKTIDSVHDAIATKCTALKGKKEWIAKVFTNVPTGRSAFMSITFNKEAIGYNTLTGFEFNNGDVAMVVDPDMVIPKEHLDLFKDSIADFLGWQNGKEGYFNEDIFKELRDFLKIEVKKLSVSVVEPSEPTVNNNTSLDPTKSNPQPSAAYSEPSSSTTGGVKIDPITGLPVNF